MTKKYSAITTPPLLAACCLCAVACTPLSGDPLESQVRSAAQAANADRSAGDSYYQAAVGAIDNRDYGLALDYLQAARNRDPHDVRVLNALGVVYDKLGRFDLSARYYAQALTVDPASAIVANNMTYSKVLQGMMHPGPAQGIAGLERPAAPENLPGTPRLDALAITGPGPLPQNAVGDPADAGGAELLAFGPPSLPNVTAAAIEFPVPMLPRVMCDVAVPADPAPTPAVAVAATAPAPVASLTVPAFALPVVAAEQPAQSQSRPSLLSRFGEAIQDWFEDVVSPSASGNQTPERAARDLASVKIERTMPALEALPDFPIALPPVFQRQAAHRIATAAALPSGLPQLRLVPAAAPNAVYVTGHPLEIVNASGRSDATDAIRRELSALNWTVSNRDSEENPPRAHTIVRYPRSSLVVARGLANTIAFPARLEPRSSDGDSVQLVVGTDFASWREARERAPNFWQAKAKMTRVRISWQTGAR